MKLPVFTRTIRFRFILWYSSLLLITGILFIVGLNFAMQQALEVYKGLPRPGAPTLEMVNSDYLELLRNYSIIGLISLIILGIVVGYFLSRRMFKPVDNLSSLAARISSSNLKERISNKGPNDELKRLSDTFDEMLERLEKSFEIQKQFVQDASHELKTPLAIAFTNIEVLEMDKQATTKDYEHLISILKPTLERMSKLSNDLLLLTDDNRYQSQWSSVNMTGLLQEILREFNAKANATGVTMEINGTIENTVVIGDDLRLRQAVSNLVDNALKYNKPGGTIKVSAFNRNSRVIIQVQDNGIGISQADLPHIFDRFYRVDKSRSRAHGGSGLGLAIVKKIIEDHKGNVIVESNPGQGSTFSIFLPSSIISQY